MGPGKGHWLYIHIIAVGLFFLMLEILFSYDYHHGCRDSRKTLQQQCFFGGGGGGGGKNIWDSSTSHINM